jgi:hypothetical protein
MTTERHHGIKELGKVSRTRKQERTKEEKGNKSNEE